VKGWGEKGNSVKLDERGGCIKGRKKRSRRDEEEVQGEVRKSSRRGRKRWLQR